MCACVFTLSVTPNTAHQPDRSPVQPPTSAGRPRVGDITVPRVAMAMYPQCYQCPPGAGVLSVHLTALPRPAGKLRKYHMEKTFWPLLTFGNLLSLYWFFVCVFGKLFHPTIAREFCHGSRSLCRSPTVELQPGQTELVKGGQ